MRTKLRIRIAILVIALLIVPSIALCAAQEYALLTDAAAQCIELIGKSEAKLPQSIVLAGAELEPTLLLGDGKVYGVRFVSGEHDAKGAIDLANDIIAVAKAEYGAPHTYETQNHIPTSLDDPTTDADNIAANLREYWNFACPEHFCCTVSISRAETGTYCVQLEFAQVIMPNVEYILSDEVQKYMPLIGSKCTDTLLETDMPEWFGIEFERSLIQQGGKVCGTEYLADGIGESDAVDCARRIFMQVCTEYGVPLESTEDENTLLPLNNIDERLHGNARELGVKWNLSFADGSMKGFGIRLSIGLNDAGAYVKVVYGQGIVDG